MTSVPESPLLIGAMAGANQRTTVEEFFELFKIPWSFYEHSRATEFGAAIASSSTGVVPQTPIAFVFGPEESPVDRELNLRRLPLVRGSLQTCGSEQIPLYTPAVAFDGPSEADVEVPTVEGRPVAVVVRRPNAALVRVGYDLFAEIEYLLSTGHATAAYADCPAVDVHIEFIRKTLLTLGMPVVEIPPRPQGHSFIVCLSHDIDFMGIRDHGIDHSFLGFIVRVFRSLLSAPRSGWNKARKNLAALLSVPAVYLGLKPDFWYPLDRYAAAEAQLPSTYFFIPFAGRVGKSGPGQRPFLRAARYHVEDYAEDLRRLEARRAEVGVHGIDAWCDSEQGMLERQVIRDISGQDDLGIRMHWLYFDEKSPAILEQSGYTYDSTLGYNDAIGYRNGTTQVFRPRGATKLLELPLNIQDTALLFPGRMHLSEAEALVRCDRLIARTRRLGGVLTINWHDRSLAPERNWDEVYRDLLIKLRDNAPWFAQAREAVAWFRRRRSVVFTKAISKEGKIVATLIQTERTVGPSTNVLPPLVLSVQPGGAGSASSEVVIHEMVPGVPDTYAIDLVQ
jgi:hypothetical protein